MVREIIRETTCTLELKLGWPSSLTVHLESELRAHFRAKTAPFLFLWNLPWKPFSSLGGQKLNEAVENLQSEEMVSMLESAQMLVERVAEVEKRKLERMVERFQSESDEAKARRQWKEIEKMVFGVDYPE